MSSELWILGAVLFGLYFGWFNKKHGGTNVPYAAGFGVGAFFFSIGRAFDIGHIDGTGVLMFLSGVALLGFFLIANPNIFGGDK